MLIYQYQDMLQKDFIDFSVLKKKRQHAPHEYAKPFGGKKTQYAFLPDQSKKPNSKGIIRVQFVAGTFIYYARAVDPTILTTINKIVMI